MTQDSNAGERNEPTEPTAEEVKAAREAQEIADGHRYMPQEMRDARDAKPERPKKPAKSLKDSVPSGERIAKVLARAGLASRREIERLIGLGKIAVNGRILETPAVLVKATDVITVDGQVIGKAEPTRLFRYHKPVGLVTTERDPEGRPTVFDKLPRDLPRVLKVGRLDLNSEGLLLLTNDGELARALELPSSGWVRRYRARALGHTTQGRLDTLKDGTTVDGVIYGPIEATLDKMQEKADGRANVWITVAITEGKNREVRKVLESIGLKVNRLIRLAYGPFQLGNLEPGEVEEVGPRVIRELLSDLIPLKNLPPEGASQTLGQPKSRFSRDKGDGPEGRRGGGDRYAGPREAKPKYGASTRPKREEASAGRPVRKDMERREFKPRDFDERPRFEGDGASRDRKPYTPRADGDFKKPYARKPYATREGGEGERRSFGKPQGEPSGYKREARSDGEGFKKPYAKKSYAPRDDIPAGEAGAYERAKREFGGARPERPQGDRPYKKPYTPREDGARPQGERAYKKPYTPREEGDRKPYGDRPRRDLGDRPAYKKPYAAREEGGERKSYDGPRKPRVDGDRPQADRPYKKPYAARDGDSRGPKREYAPRDGGQREGAERKSWGDKPRPAGGGYKPGPRSDRPAGGGFKSGPRPGGKPGFKPRTPRGE